MGWGVYLSLSVDLCETEPSVRPSSATTDPRCRQRQDPESPCGCSPQSVQCSQPEFHTFIFVLKDTMPRQLDWNWGPAFATHCLMGEGFHSDLGITLEHVMLAQPSIVCDHYCLSVNLKHVTCGRPLSVCLAHVACLISQTNVLFLDWPIRYLMVVHLAAKSILW